MSIYIDLSEFLLHPLTTGIQRVTIELCWRLPAGLSIPIRLHSGQYVSLSDELRKAVADYFSDASPSRAAEIRGLAATNVGEVIRLSEHDTLLVSEVFFEPGRLAWFSHMPDREFRNVRFVIHDLLPLTHPQYFIATESEQLCGYFHIIRQAHHCVFTSEYTRSLYSKYLTPAAQHNSIVIPLGSDSLGPRAVRPLYNRKLSFNVVGTIEPRKNHELILDAFEPLLKDIPELTLSFIGRMGWIGSNFTRRVQDLAKGNNSGFRFYSGLADDTIRNCIEECRATIYVSSAEGYGLPPVESLWAGTPVIASRAIPSLHSIGTAGIHYVDPLTPENLRSAIRCFLDDEYANEKTRQALRLTLPTWESFASEILKWCSA